MEIEKKNKKSDWPKKLQPYLSSEDEEDNNNITKKFK